MRYLLTALSCCLLYSSGAQTLFLTDSFPGKFFYLGNDNDFRMYPPCDRCDADTIYSRNYNFRLYDPLIQGDTIRMDPFRKIRYLHRLDTIQVWRVVADTIEVMPGTHYPRGSLHYRRIWEVREWHNTSEGAVDPGGCWGCNWHDYPQHVKYLLSKVGLPLPFAWVVIEGIVLDETDPQIAPPPYPLTIAPRDTTHYFIFKGGTLITQLDTASGLNTVYQPVGGGITVDHSNPYKQTIIFDYKWLPRRLQRRYKKYFHVK